MFVKEAYILDGEDIKPIQLGKFAESKIEYHVLNVFNKKLSNLYGFGGAVTEATAYNYFLLPEWKRNDVLECLFCQSGLNYNLIRLCIGSSDFTRYEYTYVKNNDFSLKSFDISEDKKFIIPFLKEAMEYSGKDFLFFASCWSAPSFMKTNHSRFQGGKLKEEYYEAHALYITKFVEAYAKEGIKVSYLTIQNEPNATQTWESCLFDSEEEIKFAEILRNTLDLHGFSTVKILGWDHNKERLYTKSNDYFTKSKVFDGVGFHWYSGTHFSQVAMTRNSFKDKLIFETEYCLSLIWKNTPYFYKDEYCGNINSGVNGMIEWNLLLNSNGGPFHNRVRGCQSPLVLSQNTESFKESKIFKEDYMFAHFIQPGAISCECSSYINDIMIATVINPNGDRVIFINNKGKSTPINLCLNNKFLKMQLKGNCLYTLVVEE